MSKYFKEIEENMDKNFLDALVPFIINSAYRSPGHPLSIKNPTSSHIKGLAVDIRIRSSRERFIILDALITVGFTRFGIADTFIHVDLDLDKAQGVIWTY